MENTITIYGKFNEWVRRQPEATAIVEDGRAVTYSELDELANSIMAKFQSCHYEFVGIVMSHGIEMVAAMLAVLKSGAAYVPAEPALPTERIGYMMRTAGVKLVITDEYCRHLSDAAPFPDASRPDGVAYVLYTSGTTPQGRGGGES